MSRRPISGLCVSLAFLSVALLAQEKPPAPSFHAADILEFPVVMQQKVAAGVMPVGTKVQAKLTIATLVKGKVIPRDAVFTGVVTVSEAKSATAPSRLGIRMDSVTWKEGEIPMKVYLTSWYYPFRRMTEENSPYDTNSRDINPTGMPFPSAGSGSGRGNSSDGFPNSYPAEPTRASGPLDSFTSSTRVIMHNVESSRNEDGTIVISSKRSNLKLDKTTTYVLAAGALLPPEKKH